MLTELRSGAVPNFTVTYLCLTIAHVDPLSRVRPRSGPSLAPEQFRSSLEYPRCDQRRVMVGR